jgi:hypothetical protein
MKKTRIPGERYADNPPIHQVMRVLVVGIPDIAEDDYFEA